MTNPNGLEYVQSKHESGRVMRLSSYFEEFFCCTKIACVLVNAHSYYCEDILLRSLAIK
jgi:hypothetical protein